MADFQSVIYFDTYMTAIADHQAGVVRGAMGRYEPTGWDMSKTEVIKVADFVIPAYHFMQQAAFFEAVARGMSSKDPVLANHYQAMRDLFQNTRT